MKFLMWIFGVIAVVVGAVYTLLFTSLGNGIVKPMIETEIQKQLKLPSKLEHFSLDMGHIDILLVLNENNTVAIKGEYSPFAQSFDVNYDVALKELQTLKSLTKTELKGSFFTDGNVKGDMKKMFLHGKSDVAKSNTSYDVVVENLNPTSIIAKVDSLDLGTLLYMLNQKSYAKADVNLDVNFKNIKAHQLDGDIKLRTKEGVLNSAVMKKDFGITIPKTLFLLNLDATLKGDDIDYKTLLNSNLAKVSSSGKVQPEPLNVAIKYGVAIKELAVLKPLTNADIRGPLKLSGTLKGSKESMMLLGRSDIAASKTTFGVKLAEFAPKSVQLNVKDLKLQKLLYMIKQPHYADALINIDADISNADVKNLKGLITTDITRGLLDSKYLTKAYEFKSLMPKTRFSAKAITNNNPQKVSKNTDNRFTLLFILSTKSF